LLEDEHKSKHGEVLFNQGIQIVMKYDNVM